MKSLRRMLAYLAPYRKETLLAMVLIIGVTITDLVSPRLTQDIIDKGVVPRDMGVIVRTALLMIGAAALGAVLAIANTIYAVRASQSFGADVRSTIVRKVQSLSFGNLDRLQTGQLIVRATSDVNQLQAMVMMSLRMLVRAPLWILGSVTMLIIGAPQLAWLMVALIPFLFVLIFSFGSKVRPMFMAVQARLDRLNQVLQENLAGVRVVKAFVRMDHENARFGAANEDLMQQGIRIARFMAILMPSMLTVVNLASVGAVWFGGVQAIEGGLTVGQLVAAINYLARSLFPLMILGGMIGPLSAADASAERILQVLDSEPEVRDQVAGLPATATPQPNGGARVAFENVVFSYDGGCGEPVLAGINLVAEPGQEVALLGATGSGKSSLVHLIPRFYDVCQGRVTLDGVDIRDLPLHDLRAQMGIALQEAVLFTGTVRDNIRYGRPEASDDEVIAAAKAAQAHDFVMAFPDGYETIVGERGANLSGGQKQRLAIARALLVQPRVLILDDSTSSVDVETETKIQEALDRLMRGRTTFVIAQRISTVLNADKIVVLERGQIAAEGTHDELMASSAIYREIYQSQLGNGGENHG
ncbi:MAG: ABC transporter ATP-binding protein [Chloroflexota bacterium]